MGVYIKGMDMPKYGDTFKVYLDAADNVLLVDTSDSSRFYTLVDVKTPHGRLIDRDALPYTTWYIENSPPVIEWHIKNAPTVIEAEGKDDG